MTAVDERIHRCLLSRDRKRLKTIVRCQQEILDAAGDDELYAVMVNYRSPSYVACVTDTGLHLLDEGGVLATVPAEALIRTGGDYTPSQGSWVSSTEFSRVSVFGKINSSVLVQDRFLILAHGSDADAFRAFCLVLKGLTERNGG